MAKIQMNEKGIVLPAIFGLAYILAAVIILVMLALIWLFWKQLFLFAIGIAVLFFAFTTIPQMVKGKEGLKYVGIASAIGALLIILSLLPLPLYSFQAGSEMPLTGEITFDKQKVQVGELVTATWDAEWWNRSYAPAGNALLAGNWYFEGSFVEMMPGATQAVNTTYCVATNPAVGCIVEEDWSWQTLEYIAQQPEQGSTIGITKQLEIPTTGLAKGKYQVSVKAKLLSGASLQSNVFASGGECYPLLTASQGFPCAGIYGQTVNRSRSRETRCLGRDYAGYETRNPLYDCPDPQDYAGCGTWCCITQYGSWHIYRIDGAYRVSCEDRPYIEWGSWVETQQEQVSFEQAYAANSGGETVAVAEFEVVESCPFDCCVDETGFADKLCPADQVCSLHSCITPIEPCPFECCEGMPQYQNKACIGEGEYCVSNACVFEPTPPPAPFWQGIVDFLISWIRSIFQYFFTIVGATEVMPGQTYSYDIMLSATAPDSDYSDGTVQYQYGNWALVNSSGAIIQEGSWEQVEGTYVKQVDITIPAVARNHALIGVIHQYDLSFNFVSGEWETTKEEVVAKEGIDLRTNLPAPEPPTPILTLLSNIIGGLWSWILGFLGLT